MDRFLPRSSSEPWFRVNNVEVTTTVLVTAVSVLSMVVWAFAAPIWGLGIANEYVLHGQIWRLATWPLTNAPSIWTALSLLIFYWFGREVEAALGRNRFLWFLAPLALVPALIAIAFQGELAGIDLVEMGLFAAFVAMMPAAQSFFGIPLWGLGAGLLAIQVLQLVGTNAWSVLLVLLVQVALALLLARSFGLSELEWIPRVPFPGAARRPAAGRASSRRPKRSGRKSGPATVTTLHPPSSPTPADLLRQAEIDVLLDKINEHGIGSLTAEERRRLDDHSRRLREEGH